MCRTVPGTTSEARNRWGYRAVFRFLTHDSRFCSVVAHVAGDPTLREAAAAYNAVQVC